MTFRVGWRPGRAARLALASALAWGCGHKDQSAAGAVASAAASGASAPRDHLAPGELVEGKEKAFALALPRDLPVERTFVGVVFASGSVSAVDVSNYVRARVRDGTVSVGAAATIFDGVRVPGDPGRVLYIRVMSASGNGGTHLEVRDITPAPQPDFPDNAARMRSVGLTPDGKLADPQHLQ